MYFDDWNEWNWSSPGLVPDSDFKSVQIYRADSLHLNVKKLNSQIPSFNPHLKLAPCLISKTCTLQRFAKIKTSISGQKWLTKSSLEFGSTGTVPLRNTRLMIISRTPYWYPSFGSEQKWVLPLPPEST